MRKEIMRRKIPALAVLMTGCMLFAAGCGAKQQSGTSAETKAETKTEAGAVTEAAREDSPEWVTKLKEAENAGIGKHGLGKEKEGDGMTPVGTYSFNYAFGIADDPGCAIPYQKVDDDSYWSGDQREGHKYNEMVSIKDLPDLNVSDSEHIVDYQNEYQHCLNISYNEDGTPGLGSAIFLHCFGAVKPYTGGCVAIPQDKMEIVMKNVRPDCVVVIDSLEKISPEKWEALGFAPTGK